MSLPRGKRHGRGCDLHRDRARLGPRLEVMQIEHYPGMTEKALEKIAGEALSRWNLGDVLVIHRYGALQAPRI